MERQRGWRIRKGCNLNPKYLVPTGSWSNVFRMEWHLDHNSPYFQIHSEVATVAVICGDISAQ